MVKPHPTSGVRHVSCNPLTERLKIGAIGRVWAVFGARLDSSEGAHPRLVTHYQRDAAWR